MYYSIHKGRLARPTRMFKSELALSLLNTPLNIKKSCPKAAPYLFFNQAFIGIMTAPSGRIISGVQLPLPNTLSIISTYASSRAIGT